jgi:CDP-2,3-bis-(O-geranylgeranyl)-sn-glycerol synthase
MDIIISGYPLFGLLFTALWLMFPVYTANNFATLLGGGRPIDLGHDFFDGRRILGDNKTYKGFILGTACGIIIGIVQNFLAPYVWPSLGQLIVIGPVIYFPAIVIVSLSFGALAGDSVKSFIKRRLGFSSGSMLPVADQLDFILGSWALTLLVAPAWFMGQNTLPILITIIIITFPLQIFHNSVGMMLGKKKVIW